MPKPKTTPRTFEIHGAPDGLEFRPYYKNRRGPFTSIPLIRTQNSRKQEPDLLDLMGELSKGARDLFLQIKRNMNYRTHLAVLPNKGLSRSQINKRSTAIKELEVAGKGLACRVPTRGITNIDGVEQLYRPSTFMLSPEYIFPGRNFEEQILDIWKQCISKARESRATKTQPAKKSATESSNQSTEKKQPHTGKTLDFSQLSK